MAKKVKPNKKIAAAKKSKKPVLKAVKKNPVSKKSTPTKKAGAKKTVVKKTAVNKTAVNKTVAKKTAPKKPSSKVSSALENNVKSTPYKSAPSNVKTPKADFSKYLTPLDNRILVQVSAGEKMTAGGLYIPDTVTDVSGNFKGVVVAVGRGHMDKKGKVRHLDVKVGDQIVFSQFSGSEVELQGHKVIFIRETDVLGVVNR